jgi:DNA (cytosine-5)-methyltransferase 1
MGQRFFTVDLFAGCGGISEGFHQAGFESVAQVEMHPPACETLRTRQMFFELKKHHKTRIYQEYVEGKISREQIFAEYPEIEKKVNLRVLEKELSEKTLPSVIDQIKNSLTYHDADGVDVFLGGPPCQPYSIINRVWAKKNRENGKSDERNYLYTYYLELLKEFHPDVFVYENVPGLFSTMYNGEKIFSRLLKDFSDLSPSYVIIPPLEKVSKKPHDYILNAVNFGVPQNRKRLILIGFREGLERRNPDICKIYERLKDKRIFAEKQIAVREAISDLPILYPGQGTNEKTDYPDEKPGSKYQNLMRRDSKGVLNHQARTHMSSDLERYRFFIEYVNNHSSQARLPDLIAARPDLTPKHDPENHEKFIDRFKVQRYDRPSSTITAHISKDGHYFIHPDIEQCRSFTVREAARCQSFPDNFFFEGPRTEQFRQVGNAVPPLLAKAVGMAVRKELEKIYS